MKKKIRLGTKDICSMCGKEIEYIGPYWRHTTYSPRHVATPSNQRVKADGAKAAAQVASRANDQSGDPGQQV